MQIGSKKESNEIWRIQVLFIFLLNRDFLKLYIDRAAEFELDSLYRHFDS